MKTMTLMEIKEALAAEEKKPWFLEMDARESPRRKDLLAMWRSTKPMMLDLLEKEELTHRLAALIEDRVDARAQKNREAGMYETDAKEEAERYLIPWEEEDETTEEADVLAVLHVAIRRIQDESEFIQAREDEETGPTGHAGAYHPEASPKSVPERIVIGIQMLFFAYLTSVMIVFVANHIQIIRDKGYAYWSALPGKNIYCGVRAFTWPVRIFLDESDEGES